jgi:cytidylate kinase
MAYRDQQDSSRALAPLCQAADAIRIDTTGLSIDDVVDLVLAHVAPGGQSGRSS